jgi:hypothetical protein
MCRLTLVARTVIPAAAFRNKKARPKPSLSNLRSFESQFGPSQLISAAIELSPTEWWGLPAARNPYAQVEAAYSLPL